MNFEAVNLTLGERELRDDIRSFLNSELPRHTFTPGLGMNAIKDPGFSRELGKRGWLGMGLPVAYGGHNRSAVERFIVVEELLRWGAPIGHHWVADRQSGPVINKFGTEEQKRRFLPRICSGELSFCIGMSESESGSDLASLSTKATRTDGGWVLEGRKIWTTAAHENDWIIVLCRTTPSDQVSDKRNGMSQLIVDLKSPGITTSQVPFIDGTADFCEVVFDSVFVPDEFVLGQIGQGWSQNTSELAYERGGPDRWLSSYLLIEELLRQETERFDSESVPTELLDLLGNCVAHYWILHHLSISVARSIDNGGAPALEASLVKELGTHFEQDVVLAVLSHVDQVPNISDSSIFNQLLVTSALTQPSFTIRGGTNEILRSVISKGLQHGDVRPISGVDPILIETVDRLLASLATHQEIENAEQTGWSSTIWTALCASGFTWVGIDESRGGSGGTTQDMAAVLYALGRSAAPVPVAETGFIAGWWLTRFGLRLAHGPMALIPTNSAQTTASISNGRIKVSAQVPWARHCETLVLNLRTDNGLLILAIDSENFVTTLGSNLAGEALDSVFIDAEITSIRTVHLPSGPELEQALSELEARAVLARLIMSAGALETILQMTLDYTHSRHQFGKPVASFQAVQHHLVTIAQSAVQARMAVDVALGSLNDGSFEIEIAAARIVIDDAIALGTRAAHQAHGAMGVTREYSLHQFTRRLWSWRHEVGGTQSWRRRLGRIVFERGADELFATISK